MDEAARAKIFEILSFIALMAVETSQKADAADEVLQHDPTL